MKIAAALFTALILTAATSRADNTATITFQNPGTSSILPGQTFTLNVYGQTSSLNTGMGGGFDLFLTSNAPTSDLQLVSQVLNTADFSPGFGYTPTLPADISGGQVSPDLGFAFSNAESLPAGTPFLLATDTFQLASATPSNTPFSISEVPGTDFFDNTGYNSETAGPASSNFNSMPVSVPEPSNLVLLFAGGGLLALFGTVRRKLSLTGT